MNDDRKQIEEIRSTEFLAKDGVLSLRRTIEAIQFLLTHIDKLEAALRPFAEAGRFFAEVEEEQNYVVKVWRRLDNRVLQQLVAGDFLKAREALGEK